MCINIINIHLKNIEIHSHLESKFKWMVSQEATDFQLSQLSNCDADPVLGW
jgi:hypothetical protein